MNATLFAALTVRAADGLCVHGTFPAHSDAAVSAEWLTDEDTFTHPIALHPPETDPIITHATAEMTGGVIELPAPIANLLAAHDDDPDPAGEVVVSLLIAWRLALFVGPFATVTDAREWIAEAAGAARSGTYLARLRIHPLRRTDTVPVAATTPGPDTEPVPAEGVA